MNNISPLLANTMNRLNQELQENDMSDDNQIKHHLYWIIKTIGDASNYPEFLNIPLSYEVIGDLKSLVSHIKKNY